jgi:hypothetical protein
MINFAVVLIMIWGLPRQAEGRRGRYATGSLLSRAA